ncbi:MAG: hypothetical protein Q9178_001988 [Gyalolechia marmorata]
MAPSTLNLACACRQITGTIDLSNCSLPLDLEFCHCYNCRHSSGQLAISVFICPRAPDNGPPTLKITSKEQPVAYKATEELIRYFCGACGASVYMSIPETGDYEICSGLLDQAEGILTFTQHIFLASTKDGGMSRWIEGPGWTGWPEKSEIYQPPTEPAETTEKPISAQEGGESNEKTKLKCYCLCRGVEFYITRPDQDSIKEQKPQHETQEQNEGEWWLRANGTKYLAGFCACNDCRLATGYDIQAWMFAPKKNVRQLDGKEIDFTMGTLKTYSHSPGAYRDFCGKCGATVFWRSEERHKELVDISVGLLDADEGARAEEWLEWWTKKVEFEELALNKSLVAKLADGLKKWEKGDVYSRQIGTKRLYNTPNMSDQNKGVLGGLTDTVGGAVGGVANTAGDAVSGVGNTLGNTTKGLTDTVGDTTKGVGNTAKSGVDSAGNYASGAAGSDKKQTAQNPLGLSD